MGRVFINTVADCDCDAMATLAHRPISVERYKTDEQAARRFAQLGPEKIALVAVHGPSGHVLNITEVDE